ncbi:TPA: EpsG family protein [Photobacterium damselae]
MVVSEIPVSIILMTLILILIFVYSLAPKSRELLQNSFYMIIFVISVIVANRCIGVDTEVYKYLYTKADYFDWNIYPGSYNGILEVGYYNFSALYQILGFPYSIFSFTCTILFFFSYYLLVNNYKGKTYLAYALLFVIYTYTFYQLNINQVRQGLAVSIILIGLHFLYNKKELKYYAFIIFASLFHITALFMLIIPIVVRFRFLLSLQTILLMIILSLLFTQFELVKGILKVFGAIIGGGVEHKLNYYLNNPSYSGRGAVNLSFILEYLGIILFSIFYFSNKEQRNDFIDYILWINAFGLFIYGVFFDFVIIAQRLQYYFSILSPMLYAYAFSFSIKSKYVILLFSCVYFLMSIKVLYSSVGW